MLERLLAATGRRPWIDGEVLGVAAVTEKAPVELRTIETQIPARMDRLPWSRWHWMVVIGLGTVWILDGK